MREVGGAWADDFAAATCRDFLGLAAVLVIDVEGSDKYDRVRI